MTSSRLHSYHFISFGSNEKFSQVRLSSAALIYYVHFNLKSHFVNTLILFTIFVRFYHAGTFCARLRARLLVCFDRLWVGNRLSGYT